MANILVVDDEMGIRELLMEILNDEGHHVILAENASQARERRQQERPDLVLLDIWMPDTDGVTLLKEWATTGLPAGSIPHEETQFRPDRRSAALLRFEDRPAQRAQALVLENRTVHQRPAGLSRQ
mgnify:CR=1 FL=1